MNSRLLALATILTLAVGPLGCSKSEVNRSVTPALDAKSPSGAITPLPSHIPLDFSKIELGRRLFFDKRLSRDGTISCANCHSIANYGVDGLMVSVGIEGKQGKVNAPSVLNSGFNFRQFWDGRASDLEEQSGGPITNSVEMGSTWPDLLKKLSFDQSLKALSKKAYGKPIDESVVRAALAIYERSLITPDSPFDKYLRGDKTALSQDALDGWHLFTDLGCVACHQGVNVGGNMYATFGVMGSYFNGRAIQPEDFGLYNRTHQEEDKFKFKVPGLRNVSKTGPYFHDGRIVSLAEAVDIMASTQLGLTLQIEQRDHLVAFLEALTGRLPEAKP